MNQSKLIKDFKNTTEKESKEKKYNRILKSFKEACNSRNRRSVANLILGNYQLPPITNNDHHILRMARLYMVCKVLSIADKYPMYSKFKPISGVENSLCTDVPQEIKGLYKQLAKHVKKKINRISVLRFVRRFSSLSISKMFQMPISCTEDLLTNSTKNGCVVLRLKSLYMIE